MENINGEAMPAFDPMQRFPDLESANAYLAGHGKAEAFAAIADQGEYILIGRSAPKADLAPQAPKKGPAKGKGKGKKAEGPKEAPKAEGKAKGKQSAAQRIAAQGDLKGKAKADPKAEGPKADPIRWRKIDLDPAQGGRKWIGPWADRKAEAQKGKGPDAGSAKLDIAKLDKGKPWNEAMAAPFSGAFSADTHWPFRKRIAELAALIRAKDSAGLRKLEIKEISTTPIMLGKLRDLAIAALGAKAEKAKGNGKAPKADQPQADQPITS
jgi:hypothetical protein